MKKSLNSAYAIVALSAGMAVVGIGLAIYRKSNSEIDQETEFPELTKYTLNDKEVKGNIDTEEKTNAQTIPSEADIFRLLSSANVPYSPTIFNRIKLSIQSTPDKLYAIIERYKKTTQEAAERSAKEKTDLAKRYEQVKGTIQDINEIDKALKAINVIPIVGQIVYGIWSISKPFADAWVSATMNGDNLFDSNWKPGGSSLFTGWLADGNSGDYFLRDIPVFSMAAEMMVIPYLEYSKEYLPSMNALIRLTEAFPYGPDVPRVEIRDTGEMYYAFNADGTNDLSDSAINAGKVFAVPVWNPLDVGPKGPRGFDRSNPRGWFRSAQAEALAQGWIDPSRSPAYTVNTAEL